ncbi:conjugal transfer protein TraF [Parapedobacter sp. SGR-10]|uniref:conjugal transfer protein TraF n=1 Tax=Parapedobacter sp. SGR-10 TaxID=2710879 RepID=UPI0013D157DE|nr:conjugal transfer protein TraF [Parapedobacter sp. SGR-10]NGF55010.1 conjugal transfer protein TraF [Parapedobacter sp. SGR-10]
MVCRLIPSLLFALNLHAQTFNAAPFLGMGNTGLGQTAVYSISNNPTGIASLDEVQVAAAYQYHFLSSEIRTQAVYFAMPLSETHTLALGANNHGLQGVSSLLTLRGAYARCFGQSFSAGISVNYHRYYVKNYDSDHTVSLDLGFQYAIDERLILGALARNVSRASYRDDVLQYVPTEYGMGFCYTLVEGLRIASDVYYDPHTKFDYRGGIEYGIDSRIFLRGGAASHPLQYFAGAGIVWKNIRADMASSFHPRLGTSPQLALAYGF